MKPGWMNGSLNVQRKSCFLSCSAISDAAINRCRFTGKIVCAGLWNFLAKKCIIISSLWVKVPLCLNYESVKMKRLNKLFLFLLLLFSSDAVIILLDVRKLVILFHYIFRWINSFGPAYSINAEFVLFHQLNVITSLKWDWTPPRRGQLDPQSE